MADYDAIVIGGGHNATRRVSKDSRLPRPPASAANLASIG